MPFGEALERFAGTKLPEVDASIERAKTKKPPHAKKRTPGGSPDSQNVVSLRRARLKRHHG